MVLAVAGLGVFIAALDQTVVVTALPSVMVDLKIPIARLDRVSWVITAYLLGYTVAMPLIGRIADVYGYGRVYGAALVLFCIGSALVAVAPSLEWMIAARVVQAVGGGATVPISLAMAARALPDRHRGLALGVIAGAAEAGSMLGPAYGGAIVEFWNWRGIFWLNLPHSAVVLLALRWLPKSDTGARDPNGRVDYWGGVLLVAALLVISLALSRKGAFTLSSALPFVLGAVGLAFVLTLIVVERRREHPLLPLLLFRSRSFITANATQLLVGVCLIIAMVTIPLMANTVMGKDPFTGAMWLLRLTGMIPVGALLGGVILGRLGALPVTVAGLVLAAAGLLLVSTWDLEVRDPALTLHLAVAGLGFGLVIAPLMTKVMESVSEEYWTTAAGLAVVARMLGMTLGLSALSAWGVEYFQSLTAGLDLPLPESGQAQSDLQARILSYQEGITGAGLSLFHNFLRVAGFVALAAIIPALALGGNREVRYLNAFRREGDSR